MQITSKLIQLAKNRGFFGGHFEGDINFIDWLIISHWLANMNAISVLRLGIAFEIIHIKTVSGHPKEIILSVNDNTPSSERFSSPSTIVCGDMAIIVQNSGSLSKEQFEVLKNIVLGSFILSDNNVSKALTEAFPKKIIRERKAGDTCYLRSKDGYSTPSTLQVEVLATYGVKASVYHFYSDIIKEVNLQELVDKEDLLTIGHYQHHHVEVSEEEEKVFALYKDFINLHFNSSDK